LEEESLALHNERAQLRGRLLEINDALPELDGQISALRRAVAALIGQPKKSAGRPRGGDPDGVNETIRSLLPTRADWSGAQLKQVLEEKGTWVTGNRVSAALSRLREDGFAVKVGIGRWAAPNAPEGATDGE
jgi:hypothetical protein